MHSLSGSSLPVGPLGQADFFSALLGPRFDAAGRNRLEHTFSLYDDMHEPVGRLWLA